LKQLKNKRRKYKGIKKYKKSKSKSKKGKSKKSLKLKMKSRKYKKKKSKNSKKKKSSKNKKNSKKSKNRKFKNKKKKKKSLSFKKFLKKIRKKKEQKKRKSRKVFAKLQKILGQKHYGFLSEYAKFMSFVFKKIWFYSSYFVKQVQKCSISAARRHPNILLKFNKIAKKTKRVMCKLHHTDVLSRALKSYGLRDSFKKKYSKSSW